MATTPNFGWVTPAPTDLVTDLPADFEIFADAVDASLVDLKGGTTGQVLAKASNTDMDFTWATDASGIPATLLDAKGDLIVASAADTAARLAVGTNGHVLTANSGATNGVEWAAVSADSYTLINSTTPSDTVSTVTISSIPTTYQHLQIRIEDLGTQASDDTDRLFVRFNGETSSIYTQRVWTTFSVGYTGDAADNVADTLSSIQPTGGRKLNAAPVQGTVFILDIPNYASSTVNKAGYLTANFREGGSSGKRGSQGFFGFSSNTAITSVTVFSALGSNFATTADSRIKIYGVK